MELIELEALDEQLPPRQIRFYRAKRLAETMHEGQKRWDGAPYFTHVSAVHELLIRHCVVNKIEYDGDIRCAAWLHDVVEDTALTVQDIDWLFNPNVARLVDLLTRREDESYLYEYIPRVMSDPEAMLIKKCDLIHNLSTLPVEHRLAKRYISALYMVMVGKVVYPHEQRA